MRRFLSTASIAALVALAGCAPLRDDAEPGAVGSQRMAVLDGQDGTWDITVMDMAGNVLQEIDANIGWANSLTYHVDDYFLVSDGSTISKVTWEGDVTPWSSGNSRGAIYRMTSNEDGTTTVAEENEVSDYDDDGNPISVNSDSSYCWMDTAIGDSGSTAIFDVFGPTIGMWDGEEVTPLAIGVGEGTNVLGRDASGNYYAASQWQDGLWKVDAEGTVENLGGLSSLGIQAFGVKAIDSAGHDAVVALYDGSMGSGIVRISGNRAEEVVSGGASVWADMTVF